jgi:hypothetical protein
MSESEPTNDVTASAGDERVGKKLYLKPEVRYERVFETMAMACGKTQTTQEQCAHNRKSS